MTNKTNEVHFEFIALMASLMSLVALTIDALLPAIPQIGEMLNVANKADTQLLITFIFLGLGFGQLIFGPLSDNFGRKPVVYVGFVIFFFGSLLCVFSKSIEMMVFGRIMQGIGLSSPRAISIAMVRDQYEGDYMARVMSFITVFFILVPTVAPALGKFILDRYDWQSIFYVQLLISLAIVLWFLFRQPETLAAENRIPFTRKRFKNAVIEIFKRHDVIGYTLISGLISGGFIVYISASQHIFIEQYKMPNEFPYIFAGLALAVGGATFLNGNLVLKYGMAKLVRMAMLCFCLVSLIYLLFVGNIKPNVTLLVAFFASQFFFLGFLFGNLKALAMQPIGHIAGLGSAITGFISTMLAVPISTYIGRFVTDTPLPLFIGFSICGVLAMLIFFYLQRTKK